MDTGSSVIDVDCLSSKTAVPSRCPQALAKPNRISRDEQKHYHFWWLCRTVTLVTLKVMLEPKSLQQLAMKTVYEHHAKLPLRYLPKRMITLLGLSETNDDLESD